MKKALVVAISAVAVILAAGVWKWTRSPGPVEIVDADGHRWHFVPVAGTSDLPLERMTQSLTNSLEKTTPVTISPFWIADRMATEGDFATIMGRAVRPGRSPDQTLVDIDWLEAVEFCDKFTQACSAQLPSNCFVSIPTTLEWGHAATLLGCPSWMKTREGTFLFTRTATASLLQTTGRFLMEILGLEGTGDLVEIDYDSVLPSTFANVGKRQKRNFTGLRPVLVSKTGGIVTAGGEELDNTVVARGVLLTELGCFGRAREVLSDLLRTVPLSDGQKDRAVDALQFAQRKHPYDIEDWTGLVALSAEYAESRGFAVSPFAEHWQKLGTQDSMEDADVATAYAAAGIVGKWVRIGDLPAELQAEQPVGETDTILTLAGEDVVHLEYEITPDTEVQVLECDFTGDGRLDLVVEEFASVGSDGYHYGFHEQLPDGTYTNRLSLQVVGLCALPPEDGGACGFIVVEKVENPVLAVQLLTFPDGEPTLEAAHPRGFAMNDADHAQIYPQAPFIGAGYGLGWSILQGSGIWYRPLFWPWRPGHVQGLEPAATGDGTEPSVS